MTTHTIRTRLVAAAKVGADSIPSTISAGAPAPAPAKESPPAPAAPKPFKVPVRTEFKLDNGLEVSLLPYGDMPKVAIQLAIDTGNVHEKATETWLADLTGKLLSEGTTTRSAEQIAQAAAQLGGSLNIGTTMDQTFVGLEVLSESAPEALALIADVIQNPAFPKAEVERVKGDLAREMAIYKSQPAVLADERLGQSLYGDHPYGRYFPPEAQLKGYTQEVVRAHYDANIGAARSRLYIVGRFDSEPVEKAVRDAFSGWKAGPERLKNLPKQRVAKAVQFIDRPGSVQSTVRVAVKALPPSSPDYVKQTVMNTLLGGYFSSRITANIREAKGYTYSPYSEVSAHLEDAYWVQNADVTTAVTGESLKEIFKEVATLRKTPPPAEELSAVQSYLAGTFLLQNSSRNGIIGQLRFVDLHGLPDSYLQDYVQSVMAVTPADIQKLAAKMLTREAMTIVVVGDQKAVAPQLKVINPALK